MIHELMLPPLRVKTLGKDIRTEWRIVVMSNKNNSIFSPGPSCASWWSFFCVAAQIPRRSH